MMKYLTILLLTLTISSHATAPTPINYAPGIDPESFNKLHPKLQQIAYFIAGFCAQNNIKFVITSTIRSKERNAQVKSVSMTHVEGRAFDFSIKEIHGWTQDSIMLLVYQIERNYKEYGAFSLGNGKQVVIFNHSADGDAKSYHSHIQIFKGLPWK